MIRNYGKLKELVTMKAKLLERVGREGLEHVNVATKGSLECSLSID